MHPASGGWCDDRAGIVRVVWLRLCPAGGGSAGAAHRGRQGESFAPVDRPGADKPAKTLVASGFPWVVLEDKEDFYRVNVDGKEFWVDSMDVRTAPVVKTKCTLGVAGKKQPVGAIMGAGANPCAAP